MAKEIIIISESQKNLGYREIRFCFWFAVPAGQELPDPQRSSDWQGASAAEITAIKNGEVIEKVVLSRLPASYSFTDLKTYATALYASIESAFTTSQPAAGYPGEYYGTFYDGTDWTAG